MIHADMLDCSQQLVDGVLIRQPLAGVPAKQRSLPVMGGVRRMPIGGTAEVVGKKVEIRREQLWIKSCSAGCPGSI